MLRKGLMTAGVVLLLVWLALMVRLAWPPSPPHRQPVPWSAEEPDYPDVGGWPAEETSPPAGPMPDELQRYRLDQRVELPETFPPTDGATGMRLPPVDPDHPGSAAEGVRL